MITYKTADRTPTHEWYGVKETLHFAKSSYTARKAVKTTITTVTVTETITVAIRIVNITKSNINIDSYVHTYIYVHTNLG